MEIESIIISACVTILSLGLLAVSLASYKKYKNVKLLFISIVFFVLLFKGMLLSISLFYPDFTGADTFLQGTYNGIFDLIVLVLLFIATLKR